MNKSCAKKQTEIITVALVRVKKTIFQMLHHVNGSVNCSCSLSLEKIIGSDNISGRRSDLKT